MHKPLPALVPRASGLDCVERRALAVRGGLGDGGLHVARRVGTRHQYEYGNAREGRREYRVELHGAAVGNSGRVCEL